MQIDKYRCWISLFVGLCVMIMSGSLYAFSVWSDALKKQLNLSNAESTLIVTVGNFGLCIATPAGIFVDKLGVRWTALAGGIMSFGGYMVFWAAVNGYITHNYIFLSAVYAVVGQGCIFSYMPALLTYQNFAAKHHGKIIGVLDCTYGLSALVISQIYAGVWGKEIPEKQNIAAFLLFLAVSMAAVNVLALFVLKIEPQQKYEQLPTIGDDFIESTPMETPKDTTGIRLLMSIDFWLLFFLFFVLQGTALSYVNNQGYIASALGREGAEVTMTALFSACSSVSRILSGVSSDFISSKFSFGLFLTFHSLIIAFALGAFALWPGPMLVPTAALVGAGFGGLWCVVPLITSSVFGTKNFGFNWGTLIIASAIGPLPFKPIVDSVYSTHSLPGATDCLGPECYTSSFGWCFGVSMIAVGVSILIALRIKKPSQYF